MPYKDPERRRQWEKLHQQQRTERRRLQRRALGAHSQPPPADRSPAGENKQKKGGWLTLLIVGAALWLGVLGVGIFLPPGDIPGRDS